MGCFCFSILRFFFFVTLVNCASVLKDDVEAQGLYNSKSDKVIIMTADNFDRKLYGQKHAQVVQFYNSYCGHCRNFYPIFKSLAYQITPWKKVFRLAVIDCFQEDNNQVCRDFNVMSYPTIRYFHENYVKANGNVGEGLKVTNIAQKLKDEIINKMEDEQKLGRFKQISPLNIYDFATLDEAVANSPSGTRFTFLVFETDNSTVGAELLLYTSAYESVVIKRVHHNSKLAKQISIRDFPAVVSVEAMKTIPIVTSDSRENMLQAIKSYLKSKDYNVPVDAEEEALPTEGPNVSTSSTDANKLYYSDFELTIKSILHTEINRADLDAERRAALINLLRVIRDYFPFKGNQNLKLYIMELLQYVQVSTGNANELTETVRNIEHKHNPYTSMSSDYIGCKGSQPKYRGYTCGLWTLFHILTVGAATQGSSQGGIHVLQAIHGFVKNFFGCTHCVKHFLAMAERNRLFDVKENDKAVLWLWVSHNEVNLRLAGDITEDPTHPKIQFPSVSQCPNCRMRSGAWNLPEVYQYLLTFYSSDNIQNRSARSTMDSSHLTKLDFGMLSFLYIVSLIIVVLVIKYFLGKHFYRKRIYKNGLGKV